VPKKPIHPVPGGLKASGRTLWQSTVEEFELEEHELVLLREACRAADGVDGLQAAVDKDGVLSASPQGLRAHPALVELRQQRICLARLIAQLGLPTGEQDDEEQQSAAVTRRQQRRATRGTYGIRGAV
jgi:hypothetical protein